MQTLLLPLAAPLAAYLAWPVPFTICAIVTFLIAFGVCLAIVLSARWHEHLSGDHLDEVQKIHVGQIPRIGGLAIAVAIAYAGLDLLDNAKLNLLVLLGIAALPAFVFGFLEDLTNSVSARARFIATLLAGIVGCFLIEHKLHSVGFESIDALLSYAAVAIVFTAIASAGLATSINMIDGLNGLSSFIGIAILIGLATIANQAGDAGVYRIAILGVCAIAGFVAFNWPFGKIFLGDGGAYFIGFFIAWIAILIRSRDGQSISAFAMLLVCAYPIIETLFSMARRAGFNKVVGAPDQKHLHHLIYFHIKYSFGVPLTRANSVAGLLTSLLAIPPILIAIHHPADKPLLIAAFWMFVALYLALYLALQKWAAQVEAQGGVPVTTRFEVHPDIGHTEQVGYSYQSIGKGPKS